MSLKYFVHVSSISNLSDARYCSGMMVDSLGYNFDENSNFKISTDTSNEISKWVNGVKFIAEFNNSSTKYINSILDSGFFDAIELNIENTIKGLNFNHKSIIVKISDPNKINYDINDFLSSNFPNVETLIIDNLNLKNIEKLEYIDKKYMLIINPYNDFESILEFLDKYNYGLLLKGSSEIRPGLKDYDSISNILEKIQDLS
tara:strand:+ start:1506 stop:2111 length:606 start_codon:yes stop_codon:yes gene_type:complete